MSTFYKVVSNPYTQINSYGSYNGYGNYGSKQTSKLPKVPDNIMGVSTKDLGEYKAVAEEFAPTIARLVAGMSPIEQYAQLEARIKVMNHSPWRNVPVVGSFLTSRLAEYKARLIALEEEMEDYREAQRKKQLALTLGIVGAGTLILYGLTGVIKNIVQATK